MRRGGYWSVAGLVVACSLAGGPHVASACTTIVVGKNATSDGSTMCTHNADCLDCDFRLGRVPARDWPSGSKRPIVKFRAEYPRTVSEDRGITWTADNLDPELPQAKKWTDNKWREAMVIGHIPQVNHTFAYLEGLYGIINEKQVGIGESTCGAKWFAGPLSEDCEECNSLLDISELSRIALERSSTAREAIQMMGDLAVEFGFYGSAWDSEDPLTYEEAGEALTVSDTTEAWVFHVLSDDTTTSAVWAAQRVPDDHVSVVANQFVIKEVFPDADPDQFMFSSNLFEVAERGGCGYKRGSGFPLHFTKAFTKRPGDFPHYSYTTRRVWRVFDILAPSLDLSPYTDTWGQDYPFSAKPDKTVTTMDVIDIVRDHYEGSDFDLTKGVASGPYGDVDRYDWSASLDGTTSLNDTMSGFFERSISLFRTSYSSVTQSRSHLPDEVGALLWVAQYKPSMSTYIPLYVNIDEVPRPYTIGSLFRFSKEASYWAFSVVGNWAERFRVFAHKDVMTKQATLEGPLFQAQGELERQASDLVNVGDMAGATAMLTKHSNDSAISAVSTYHELFDTLVARYHDGYQMEDPTAETIKMGKLFYPKWWLEVVGYFNTIQDDAEATSTVAAESTKRQKGAKHPSGDDSPECPPPSQVAPSGVEAHADSASMPPSLSWQSDTGLAVGALFFTVVGIVLGRWSATRAGYYSLSEAV